MRQLVTNQMTGVILQVIRLYGYKNNSLTINTNVIYNWLHRGSFTLVMFTHKIYIYIYYIIK